MALTLSYFKLTPKTTGLLLKLGISKKGTIRTAWGPAHSTRQWVATALDVEQQGMFEYVPEENRVIDSPLTVASSTKLGP